MAPGRAPSLAAARDLVSGDGGCHAVVRDELLVVGPVVHCGLPSDSFMAYDVATDSWRDSYAHARRSRRCARPCPPLPEGRRFAACGSAGGRLLVCGGETEQALLLELCLQLRHLIRVVAARGLASRGRALALGHDAPALPARVLCSLRWCHWHFQEI